jgi:prepilin-type N-terminal cleavage/methylation domain-containing protein
MTIKTHHRNAFTLLELLVVIAIIGILAALIFPALSRAKMKGQGIACMNNLRQLSQACKMYDDDSSGMLVSSWPLGDATAPVNPYSWCPGWASTQPEIPMYGPLPNFAATNEYALQQGKIWPYVKSVPTYRCPADKRTLGGLPVVRSYSMNSWMAGRSYGDPAGSTDYTAPENDAALSFIFFRRENQINNPSQTWTLIDEDASSINDSMFIVDMAAENNMIDMPSIRHGSVFEIGFADGHMDAIKWTASTDDWQNNDPNPDQDWVKLKSMTTFKK